MSRSCTYAFLRICRLTHLYLGIFTAPALIFFAFTGALQTFSLHEATRGSSYKPPAWAVTLGQIHKKQTPVVRKRPTESAVAANTPTDRRPHISADQPAGAGRAISPAAVPPPLETPSGRNHHPLPLKIFFLMVSIGLFLSTVTGIYMSYKYMRNRTRITVLLILGLVVPFVLVFV